MDRADGAAARAIVAAAKSSPAAKASPATSARSSTPQSASAWPFPVSTAVWTAEENDDPSMLTTLDTEESKVISKWAKRATKTDMPRLRFPDYRDETMKFWLYQGSAGLGCRVCRLWNPTKHHQNSQYYKGTVALTVTKQKLEAHEGSDEHQNAVREHKRLFKPSDSAVIDLEAPVPISTPALEKLRAGAARVGGSQPDIADAMLASQQVIDTQLAHAMLLVYSTAQDLSGGERFARSCQESRLTEGVLAPGVNNNRAFFEKALPLWGDTLRQRLGRRLRESVFGLSLDEHKNWLAIYVRYISPEQEIEESCAGMVLLDGHDTDAYWSGFKKIFTGVGLPVEDPAFGANLCALTADGGPQMGTRFVNVQNGLSVRCKELSPLNLTIWCPPHREDLASADAWRSADTFVTDKVNNWMWRAHGHLSSSSSSKLELEFWRDALSDEDIEGLSASGLSCSPIRWISRALPLRRIFKGFVVYMHRFKSLALYGSTKPRTDGAQSQRQMGQTLLTQMTDWEFYVTVAGWYSLTLFCVNFTVLKSPFTVFK